MKTKSIFKVNVYGDFTSYQLLIENGSLIVYERNKQI